MPSMVSVRFLILKQTRYLDATTQAHRKRTLRHFDNEQSAGKDICTTICLCFFAARNSCSLALSPTGKQIGIRAVKQPYKLF